MSKIQVIYSEQYLKHNCGIGHPERPERLKAIVQTLQANNLKVEFVEPEKASEKDLELVHSKEHIEMVKWHSENEIPLDADTIACRDTFEIAKLAAGGAIKAAKLVQSGKTEHCFVLCRPPGHHAALTKAMGFCFFNNLAIALRRIQKKVQTTAILDFDVHHGNGTQDIFYAEPVLYCSLHQKGIFPHTGLREEIGSGAGKDYTLNVPLLAGTPDRTYLAKFDKVMQRIGKEKPELLFISAGFDAHKLDPLANLELSTECFAKIAQNIKRYNCILCLEGGYNLNALADSVLVMIKEFSLSNQ